jgi:hypothetical protein
VRCTTTCGSTGTGTCSETCTVPEAEACTPPLEVCNGDDDDCDGVCDDLGPGTCCREDVQSCSIGTCVGGTQTCTNACTWGTCTFTGAPANDTCSGTIPTVPDAVGTISYSGSSCAAGNDNTYSCSGVTGGGPDVLYRLVLAARRVVTIDTLGTAFDALLFLRSGSTCPGSSSVACDNDGAGGGQAMINRTLDAGTYWLILDGLGTEDRGAFQVNVAIAPAPVPANDTCAGAATLTMSGSLATVAGDTSSAGDDNPGCAGSAGPDVWYTFSIPSGMDHVVYFDTVDGGAWDSVLHLRRGTCAASATVACSDNACGGSRSQLTAVLSGGTYYLVVDGASAAASGAFTLRHQASMCSRGTLIGADGRFCGATPGQGNDSTGTCQTGGPGSQTAPDVYYFMGLCPGRTVRATTCDAGTLYDTAIYARRNGCNGTQVDCDDDIDDGSCIVGAEWRASAIRIDSGAWGQGLYYVIVDGWGSAEGSFCLNVSGM